MFGFLGSLLKRRKRPGDTVTRAEFDALAKRLEALDEVQLIREASWVALRDQLKRQLGRLAAYDQRDRQRENGEREADDGLRALLARKYPRLSGGE